MKVFAGSLFILFCAVIHSFGQDYFVGNEKYNSYKLIIFYDNLPGNILPQNLFQYYQNLTDSDIDTSEQLIDTKNQERRINIITKTASKYYLSITRYIADHFLQSGQIVEIKYIINDYEIVSDDIVRLLKIKKENAKNVSFTTNNDE
ncbi:MAG: hypothetical protein LIO77_03640, partial [Rikenellaceae bacterium]|nr:hypothetical protein [Rikenellaceae bacterium]